MEELILLDTTELLRVMPRKLHAAWAELSGTKVRMPPAVADELAPAGVLQSRTTALSVAEELLQPAAPALADERRQQLERQAWWAAMWRDPASPYEKLQLTAEQRELHATLLSNLPRECFPTANPLLLADNRDTQIVGETLALGGMAVAAACFRAKLAGQPAPAGERTARVLAGYRRTAGDRGRGQARPFGVSDLAAVLATCHRPRRRGRGVEGDQVALERGRGDAVIAGLLFMAGMRRSEVSALRWADVVDSTDGDGILATVRRSKTNQDGEANDVRFVKDGVARALRTLRAATSPEPGHRVVPLSAQMIGLRFTAAARTAGVESRVTAHSGRVGLASELTSRGASTTDVMLAGNWKTSRMVAHYSAGATAERGAVARYL